MDSALQPSRPPILLIIFFAPCPSGRVLSRPSSLMAAFGRLRKVGHRLCQPQPHFRLPPGSYFPAPTGPVVASSRMVIIFSIRHQAFSTKGSKSTKKGGWPESCGAVCRRQTAMDCGSPPPPVGVNQMNQILLVGMPVSSSGLNHTDVSAKKSLYRRKSSTRVVSSTHSSFPESHQKP